MSYNSNALMAGLEALFGTPPLHNRQSIHPTHLALRILTTTGIVFSIIEPVHLHLLLTHIHNSTNTISLSPTEILFFTTHPRKTVPFLTNIKPPWNDLTAQILWDMKEDSPNSLPQKQVIY